MKIETEIIIIHPTATDDINSMSRRATLSCLALPPTENEKEEMPDTERAELLSMKSYHLTRKLTDVTDNPSRGAAPSNEDPESRNIEELTSNPLICSKTSLCGRDICRR